MKIFIKWAGGKTQLLKTILPMIPENFGTYYEPFVGGGSLFLALTPEKAVINDLNEQLINVYEQIRDNLDELLPLLDKLQNEHNLEEYYTKRKRYNELLAKGELSLESAALFMYLNKSCFNGLYRLNKKGLFNAPSNKKDVIHIYEEDNLREVSAALKKVQITSGDFEKACKDAKAGDFVFLDSPYYNTHDKYNAGGFSQDDHIRLAKLFKELTDRGVKCMLTNSNEDFIKELYKDYNICVVSSKVAMNCKGDGRKGTEIIVTNYKQA